MGLFSWMITGHFVGDFLLQTRWMAESKAKNPWALLVHSGVYTASVTLLALPAGGLRWYAVLLVMAAHVFLDNRAFSLWWCKHITKSADIPWLLVAVDQSFHVLFLAGACALSGM